VLRLSDIGLLVAPNEVLNIDVAERLEAALPDLAGQSAGRLTVTTPRARWCGRHRGGRAPSV
jgi:hypothetical protein